jgi:aminopeptidase N
MAARQKSAQRVYLRDYAPPDYRIPGIQLQVDLDRERTRVRSCLAVERSGDHQRPLVLHGEKLDLISVKINGETLDPAKWHRDETTLTLNLREPTTTLQIETEINPAANSELNGLYASADTLCTQCEPEGFRRITYFLDRPDVLSVYRVTLRALKAQYPVLLANGNQVEGGDDGIHHYAIWDDPHPKPCYLFALVAGPLQFIEGRFSTCSGREVLLRIYARSRDIPQCDYALAALREAMIWDEKVYGCEYDLGQYNIVAVEDFNMGAMENKGLNIFNTRYVLAQPATATDHDYRAVRDVIGHEYLHNWSGNRVTLRDWFQLSLKEGFTVFREQQFSADHGSAGVKRIEDANLVRTQQFREDMGPMAHPVRPESFVEINNFYTLTVYIKGAELVRILSLLVGAEGFLRGCRHYFEHYDGEAVTTDNFVGAMEAACGVDLSQFRRWYQQAGTPRIEVSGSFDPDRCRYCLRIAQNNPDSAGEHQPPLQMPIIVAFFDAQGKALDARSGGNARKQHEHTLVLTDAVQEFTFTGLASRPIPSLLRGFSAPVMVQTELSDQDLVVLAGHDDDPFCRWDAGQTLARKEMLRWLNDPSVGVLDEQFAQSFGKTLCADLPDRAFQALALRLPEENYLGEFVDVIDPEGIHLSRWSVMQALARRYTEVLLERYHALEAKMPYQRDSASAAARELRNTCLGYLMTLESEEITALALKQLKTADNMTDALAALAPLANQTLSGRDQALSFFEDRWSEFPLVMDKWLRVQAVSRCGDTLARVRKLTRHSCYQQDNPNKIHALIGALAHANPLRFHEPDGSGYQLVAEQLLATDPKNPQVAARLASAFNLWRRYEPGRRERMHEVLQKISGTAHLSRDVGEIVERALAER